MSASHYHGKADLRTLAHLSAHALFVFGPPFLRVFSRHLEAALQMAALNVAESPPSCLWSIKKLINVILSSEDQSHLALLVVSNSTVTGAPPSSELEGLLRVHIVMLLSKTIQPGRVRSRVRKTPTPTAIAYHAERFR
jgi:hypothetical protein